MHRVQVCGLLLWSGLCVCVFVCLLDITLSCAKMAELIELLFGVWTQVASRKHILDGGPDSRQVRGSFLLGNVTADYKVYGHSGIRCTEMTDQIDMWFVRNTQVGPIY